jgi:endonuclease V-like protein UPF0215 family
VLEGVISDIGESCLSEIISGTILGSKHYGQIRIILLDENMLPESIDHEYIWKKTEKPVLVITNDVNFDPRFMFQYKDKLIYAAGIHEKSAKRVLDKIYGEKGSEALRVASIILRSIPKLHNV